MRSEQAFKNMAANLFLQIVVFISGIILPRFILQAYGSSINGMITSVNQFLTYLGLAEAGVATASVVALYTPLALGRKDEVNSILSAARKFYNRSGVLFLSLTAVLVFIYPFFISGQLDNSLVRWMIVVLAGSTLVDYFFLGKYRVLLMANQEGYVVALIQSAGTVANMVVSIGLIYAGASVLAVKAVATGVYVLRLFLVKAYAKKKYPDLDFHAQPAEGALKQKNGTGELPLFYLQGGWAPDRVGWLKRHMVQMVTRSIRRQLEEKGEGRTPEEQVQLEFLIRGGSFVRPEKLQPIRDWLAAREEPAGPAP